MRVDLTLVPARVPRLDRVDLEDPRLRVGVRGVNDLEPVVGRVGVLCHRQDVQIRHADPRHLWGEEGESGQLVTSHLFQVDQGHFIS